MDNVNTASKSPYSTVITRSRPRTEQWTEQDNVRELARQWVETANSQQAAEIQAQVTESTASGGQVNQESAGSSDREIPDISELATYRSP
jgi:predicted nucleotidyltransferase